MAIEEILRECGFTSFHFAVSLDEAVAAARERCPRLITADVELKPGSGIDAVRMMCSQSPIPPSSSLQDEPTRMPQHPVLSKPFRMSEVEAAVRQVMNDELFTRWS